MLKLTFRSFSAPKTGYSLLPRQVKEGVTSETQRSSGNTFFFYNQRFFFFFWNTIKSGYVIQFTTLIPILDRCLESHLAGGGPIPVKESRSHLLPSTKTRYRPKGVACCQNRYQKRLRRSISNSSLDLFFYFITHPYITNTRGRHIKVPLTLN